MARTLGMIYGFACYLFFFVTFLYAIGFTGNVIVSKTIDHGGVDSPLPEALLIDVLLLGVFAIQHSVMARRGFKAVWTKIVPKPVERSTYVLFATAALALICWQWRPITTPVWSIENQMTRDVVEALFWVGYGVVLLATFALNHFELFGLQQVVQTREPGEPEFKTPSLYRYVRHPIYLGFLIAFWATPDMSLGHLVFSIGTTGYIFIGIALEERDLIHTFGERYRQYRREVRMLLPWPRSTGPDSPAVRDV